ncbi:MAG: hypothetical protein ACOY45_01690 [Pseudomonadota bacterium]
MSRADALAHLQAAIDALSLQAIDVNLNTGIETPEPEMRVTVADELDDIERVLSARGKTRLAPIAAEIRVAMVEIVAARNALRGLL